MFFLHSTTCHLVFNQYTVCTIFCQAIQVFSLVVVALIFLRLLSLCAILLWQREQPLAAREVCDQCVTQVHTHPDQAHPGVHMAERKPQFVHNLGPALLLLYDRMRRI
jgi:hypothetical protein